MTALSPEAVGDLLYDLCVDLGFCLPPAVQEELRASPPTDVDAFTETVFRLEGVDATPHGPLWHQARELVAQAFRTANQ
ncbi:hypothetical protein [Actinomadura sp. WMMB 499]|uniref:hypothetical protein n=1 Tax=Actinomadura sp. WMMB 499 TaxID=1219491 RepID=UPI001248C887|nr:hypothetical protein [Actinomadura sp. WMMB 499]QFG20907.1 hypothetical protein F7P10_06880 [Actinomadura sp. WMMB 499]